jgi:hypothetical protein
MAYVPVAQRNNESISPPTTINDTGTEGGFQYTPVAVRREQAPLIERQTRLKKIRRLAFEAQAAQANVEASKGVFLTFAEELGVVTPMEIKQPKVTFGQFVAGFGEVAKDIAQTLAKEAGSIGQTILTGDPESEIVAETTFQKNLAKTIYGTDKPFSLKSTAKEIGGEFLVTAGAKEGAAEDFALPVGLFFMGLDLFVGGGTKAGQARIKSAATDLSKFSGDVSRTQARLSEVITGTDAELRQLAQTIDGMRDPNKIEKLITDIGKKKPGDVQAMQATRKGVPISKELEPLAVEARKVFNEKTGIFNLDELIGKNIKGKTADVVRMTPDEYLARIPEVEPTGSSLAFMRKQLSEGKKLSAPSLDFSGKTLSQEGRNRAILAKELGIKEIPVVIVRDSKSQLTDFFNQAKITDFAAPARRLRVRRITEEESLEGIAREQLSLEAERKALDDITNTLDSVADDLITTEELDLLRLELGFTQQALEANPARQLTRYTNKRTGELPEVTGRGPSEFARRGDDIVTELGFRDSEEARAAFGKYLIEKRSFNELKGSVRQSTDIFQRQKRVASELVEGRERMTRALQREIKQAVSEAIGEARKIARVETRAKVKGFKEGRLAGFQEARMRIRTAKKAERQRFMAFQKRIKERSRKVKAAQEFFNLTDVEMAKITRRRDVRLMDKKQFDNFMQEVAGKAQAFAERSKAVAQLKGTIFDKELRKTENIRKAMKFPTVENMSISQLTEFDNLLSQYKRGDEFLGLRKLETVDRTDLKGIKTLREARERLAKEAGVSVKELESIKVVSTDRLRFDTSLAEKNPFYRNMVEGYSKSMLEGEARFFEIRRTANTLIKEARKSRKRGLVERAVPTDEQIFKYIEAPSEGPVITSGLAGKARKFDTADEFVESQRKVFHQTSPEVAAKIEKEGFRVDIQGSGASDTLPLGVNTKATTKELLIKGRGSQVEAFLPADAKVKSFATRNEAERFFRNESDVFRKADDNVNIIDRDIAKRANEILDRKGRTRTQVLAENKEAQRILDEGRPKMLEQAKIAKEEATRIMREQGFDAIEIKRDIGGFGETDNLIVLDPKLLKTKSQLTDIFNQVKETRIETKTQLAKQMTKEELDASNFIIGEYARMRDYLVQFQVLKKYRSDYITHIRRGFLEEWRAGGPAKGLLNGFKSVFKQYQLDEAVFNILDSDTGQILPLEKFFQFSMRRTGQIAPTQNVARAFLTYAKTFEKKAALDSVVPKLDIYAHSLTPARTTPRGLEFDRSLKRFVNEWVNTKKGRVSRGLFSKQGDELDIGLRFVKMFTLLHDLGLNIPVSIAAQFGEQATTFTMLGTKRYARGIARLNSKRGKKIVRENEAFLGRTPWDAFHDASNNIADRLSIGLMGLFKDATVRANKIFMLGSMSDAEWKAAQISSERLSGLRTEMGRYRVVEDASSIVGATTEGQILTQYKKWAIPIARTTFVNAGRLAKMLAKRDPNVLKSREFQELFRSTVVISSLVLVASAVIGEDEDDKSFTAQLISKARRDALSTIGALDPTAFANAPRVITFLEDLATAMKQIAFLEEYKTKEGLVGVQKLKRTITPVAVKQFIPSEEKKKVGQKGTGISVPSLPSLPSLPKLPALPKL